MLLATTTSLLVVHSGAFQVLTNELESGVMKCMSMREILYASMLVRNQKENRMLLRKVGGVNDDAARATTALAAVTLTRVVAASRQRV